MAAAATNRFVDPAVLAEVARLDLIAKTVVDGFVAGLHRSPDFGFSQEFSEYRPYTPGDDPRHVDWNVFARTGKTYLKRYRGETNAELTLVLDASASMSFGSGRLSKFDYARYVAAALAYVAHLQRDSTGLVIFHERVSDLLRPSSRQGQWMRVLHAIDNAVTGKLTDYERPFIELRDVLKRRGMTVILSDFLTPVHATIQAIEPLRVLGSEVILFQVLDPKEIDLQMNEPALLLDMETDETIEVTPDYARKEYRDRISAHIAELKTEAQGSGLDYFLLRTDKPLDTALSEYLTVRRRRF
jgi:uncharacterized protein (DUF58 family)